MISIEGVYKAYRRKRARFPVFENASIHIESKGVIGVLGAQGSGKSTFLRLLCRRERPDRGQVKVEGRVSLPLGGGLGFSNELTGRENAAFIGRLYGIDALSYVDRVAELARLGDEFDQPVSSYKNPERQLLAFSVVLASDSEWYLADDRITVDAVAHKERFAAYFDELKANKGIVLASSNAGLLRAQCDRLVVIRDRDLHLFDDVEEGIAMHKRHAQTQQFRGGN